VNFFDDFMTRSLRGCMDNQVAKDPRVKLLLTGDRWMPLKFEADVICADCVGVKIPQGFDGREGGHESKNKPFARENVTCLTNIRAVST
jgi:hypothetical protein